MTTATRPQRKTTYSIDKAHSEATFQVRHLLTKVRGRFSDFEGTIDYDEQNPERSSVNVTIQAASIDTTRARSRHASAIGRLLRRREVPDADVQEHADHAEGQRQLRRRRRPDDPRRHQAGHASATFLGKAKDPWGNERIAFEAETTINRKDYGLHWNAALETGGFLVGDEVKISLSVQAVPKTS